MRRLFLVILLVFTIYAHAEKADSKKPLQIESNNMEHDDKKLFSTFNGNAHLTRGTLTMKGGKMTLQQDASGYQYGVVYAAENSQAFFRQKQDGGKDVWVEGYAQRMEYDTKKEIAKLFTKAKLRRFEGKKLVDEVDGDLITYDTKTELYYVENDATPVNHLPLEELGSDTTTATTTPSGRVKIVIQPNKSKK